jgi:hypothetical protein
VQASAELGPRHPQTLAVKENFSVLRVRQGNDAEARRLLAEVVSGRAASLGRTHDATLRAQQALGRLIEEHGDLGRARQLYAATLAGFQATHGPADVRTVDAKADLDEVVVRIRRAEDDSRRAQLADDNAVIFR